MEMVRNLFPFRLSWLLRVGLVLLLGDVDATVSAQLTGNGLSVVLNDINYFISPFTAGYIAPGSMSHVSDVDNVYGFAPITVVQEAVTRANLEGLFTNWTTSDDVFQDGFTGAVFLSTEDTPYSLQRNVANGTTSSYRVLPLNSTVASGPYFIQTSTGALHQAYRLYDDFAGSFTTPLLQSPEGIFQPLSAQVAASATMTIGVPSRLYFTKTAEKPLAGVRIAVKDIYQLAGVKSSYGNRAWYNLYPENNITGTAIQRLIDAGAQIVGLQKPSQFANGATATADWVDYHAPFNPRGDGYQDPSSSSSGAGASIASYGWLDLAVGSDTGGSIRNPAEVGGVFGNRPSHGLVALDRVMPLSGHLDTAGFLARDPYVWDAAQAVLYGDNYTSLAGGVEAPAYPKTIYMVDFPANVSSEADAVLVHFADKLASFVGGTTAALNLSTAWASSNVTGAGGASLDEFLNTTYAVLIAKEQTALVRDPFYADYAAIHDNRVPYVDPSPLIRWAWADGLPSDALSEAVHEKTVFMDWFNSAVLPPVVDDDDDADHPCSPAMLIYPGSTGAQQPRDAYGAAPGVPLGFSSGRVSVFSECPDSVFPVGQVGGYSNATRHVEYFPVTVDVVVARGCDGLLARLAQDLVAEGLVLVPEAGQTVYGGDVLMR